LPAFVFNLLVAVVVVSVVWCSCCFSGEKIILYIFKWWSILKILWE